METPTSLVETLVDSVEAYSKTTIELVKLKSVEQTVKLVAPWISRLIVLFILLAFGLLITIGMALWLGEILGKTYYGFFIVAGFYLAACLFVRVLLYQWLINCISNSIFSHYLLPPR